MATKILRVAEKIKREDGKLTVTFETDGVPEKVLGMPDLPDKALVAWMKTEKVRAAAEKAEHDARHARNMEQ